MDRTLDIEDSLVERRSLWDWPVSWWGKRNDWGKSFPVSSGWCVSSTQTILYLTAKLTSLLLAKNP